MPFVATAAEVDALGHVNNAAWVRWLQDIATAHWTAAADPVHVAAYLWVVTRHEIDYLRALPLGGQVTGRTWVGDAPTGARFDRHVEFVGGGEGGANGRVHVRARTTWAMLDRNTGRAIRIAQAVAAPFLS